MMQLIDTMHLIDAVTWTCLVAGAITTLCSVGLVIFEGRNQRAASKGATALAEAVKKVDQQQLDDVKESLSNATKSFAEFEHALRGVAKSVQVLIIALVFFLTAASLAVVDHAVAWKNRPTTTSMSPSSSTKPSTIPPKTTKPNPPKTTKPKKAP